MRRDILTGAATAGGAWTPEGGMGRVRTPELAAGLGLVVLGIALLAGIVVPGIERYVVLSVGLVILVFFLLTRSPGALIGGGIVSGVGVGIALASLEPGRLGGALFLVSLGCGFLFVWLIGWILQLHETRVWPLIPGAILVLVGASTMPGWGLPLMLIAIGMLLLLRGVRGGGGGRIPRTP
jgi:hypothetical protein